MTSIKCLIKLEREEDALDNFLLFDKVHDLDESKNELATLAFNQEKYLTAIRYFDQVKSDLGNDAKMKKVYALSQ